MNTRELLRSWTSRGIILVLVVAFAAWGISDMLTSSRTGDKNDVATVGKEHIDARQIEEDSQRELANTPGLDAEAAKRQSLGRLIGASLVRQEADTLGVSVTDDMVRAQIMQQAAFHDEAGQFDRKRYDAFLHNNRWTAEIYEKLLRGDLSRAQVISAVVGDRAAPRTLAEAVYRAQGETRSALSAIVPRDDNTPLPEPDQAVLEAFHKDNAVQFTAPEYRTATILRLAPEALAGSIELSDDDVKAEYDERAAEFKLPETRTIEQLQAPDEALIKEAVAMLAEGKSFEEVTTALTAKGASTSVVNNVARNGLPKEIADVVFEVAQDRPSPPVKTAFGWSLFRVKEIVPARTRSFEDAKDELRKEMSLQRAGDSVGNLAKTLEDELAGGANIEQAAKAVGLDTMKITTDRSGFDKAGAEVLADTAEREEILDEVFKLAANGDSGLKDSKGSTLFVAHLDAIEEAKLRPFAEVREKVVTLWQLTERLKRASDAAQALADKVKGGASLAEAAKEQRYEVVTLQGLARLQREDVRGVTQDIVHRLFAQSPDSPGPIVAPIPEGYAVALLQGRQVPDASGDKETIDRLADQLGRMRANDYSDAYRSVLMRRYVVTLNQTKLAELFPAAAKN